jgi:hypothetical protein
MFMAARIGVARASHIPKEGSTPAGEIALVLNWILRAKKIYK